MVSFRSLLSHIFVPSVRALPFVPCKCIAISHLRLEVKVKA